MQGKAKQANESYVCLVAVQLARAREHVQFALQDRSMSCHGTHDGAAGATRRPPGCHFAFLSLALLYFALIDIDFLCFQLVKRVLHTSPKSKPTDTSPAGWLVPSN